MSASVPWRRDEHIIKCGKCNAPLIEGQCGCRSVCQGVGMIAGFTPGPWQARAAFNADDTYRIMWKEYGQGWVRERRLDRDNAGGYSPENARLLAAAPDLLDALELIFREWSLRCDPNADFPDWPDDAMAVMNDAFKNDFYAKARAAIAKARGEQV